MTEQEKGSDDLWKLKTDIWESGRKCLVS